MDTRTFTTQLTNHPEQICEVFDHLDEGIVWLDEQFRISGFNQTYLHLLGFNEFEPLIDARSTICCSRCTTTVN